MDVRMPDGTIVQNVPDGTTKEQLLHKLRSNGMEIPDDWTAPPSLGDKVSRGALNLLSGAVRGAGSIGATIMAPVDVVSDALDGKGLTLEGNRQRRASMDEALQEHFGADPESGMYKAGKIGAEIAGTSGVAGVVGKAIQGAGAARLGTAVASGGFRTGAPAATTIGGRVADAGVRAAGGGISGGVTAAAVDPETVGTGAAVGAALPGAAKLVGAAGNAVTTAARSGVRAVRAAAEPFTASGREAIAGRVLTEAAGPQAAAVAPRLAQASELVPGSMPTAAQVAENGGIAALERAVAAKNPTQFADRATEQTAARMRAVEDIAGDVGQRDFHEAARNAAAEELYGKAFSVPLKLEDLSPAMRGEVQKLLQMPAIQAGIRAARDNAKNHGMKVEAAGSVAGLHQAKLAMDDMISQLSSGATGAQANKAAAIRAARDRLVTFIERVSPDYAEARATYAAMSKPINQQEVGQELLEKLRPALGEAGAVTRENGESYARALRDGDGLVKRATGRNMPLEQVMEPEQLAQLNAVAEDLARKTNAADLARGPGSNTFQNFAVDNIAKQSGMPRVVRAAMDIPIVRKLPQMLYERPEQQIQEELIRSLLYPQTAAQRMTGQMQRQAALDAPKQPLLSDETRQAIEILFSRAAPVAIPGR